MRGIPRIAQPCSKRQFANGFAPKLTEVSPSPFSAKSSDGVSEDGK